MSQENIKNNTVDAQTLFVGVGGIGSGIITMIAEMCRPGETDNINFVCLDTNANDLLDITVNRAKITAIQTSNNQTVGSYLDCDADALRNWFPNNAVLYDKSVSEGAGQVRAISRLALNSAIKTGKIRPLYDAIDDLFRKTGAKLKQAMRCILVSSASGGTGSGIILPLAMCIRDYVKNKYSNTSLIIRSLLLLPETLSREIQSDVERKSQSRNAYATIKEINAFMMKGSGFFDNNEELKRYTNLHIDFPNPGTDELKALSLLPFDFCFLLDGQNAEDHTLTSLEQYKQQAALALYEQNIGPMQKRSFSMEDNIIKEITNPGNYGRNRFGGIGASVIRYPYEDIADYIAYNWAVSSIGGEGEAAKWTRYDNAYELKKKEAERKGIPETERPELSEVYTEILDAAVDPFSKNLKNKFLSEAKSRIRKYFNALTEQIHECLTRNVSVQAAGNAVNHLAAEIDYLGNDSSMKGRAVAHKNLLRTYEMVMRKNTQKIAANAAEAIFINEAKTISENKLYTLEAVIKNAAEETCHPNAVRYMLYSLKLEMDKRIKNLRSDLDKKESILAIYAPNADDVSTFDAGYTPNKHEKNLDELCAAEKAIGEDPSITDKARGYKKIYDKFNECFPNYCRAITDWGKYTAELEAYKKGIKYIKQLCKEYERFFKTFKIKVASLTRRQESLVDSLKFYKGDSIRNVCASKEMLEEICRTTVRLSEEGSMLDSELNAAIFDAVKANVRHEREIQNDEFAEEGRRIDIFDEILLGYFKKDVRRTCENINLNIIEAIAMENRLQSRIKFREEQEMQENTPDSEAKAYDGVTIEDNIRYIKDVIGIGERLCAPGIQRIPNVESREIRLCAYNSSLLNMRSYRIKELIVNGDAVDTVSKYELRFFNALYNLTPDKLSKFACPKTTKTGQKSAGLYHTAYFDYSKNIGPDSTKNTMISTHIDKRWDSIAVMPEIDIEYQNARMMRVHQAMVYALIHGAIKLYEHSPNYPCKKIYKYENSDERSEQLIVSNETPCDEFYEILNALYINSAIVEDIEAIKKKRRSTDKERHSNYRDTTFAKDVDKFQIEILEEEKSSSLFEIPLVYYNSLPNSLRFSGEIAAVVDAVIRTFKDETELWEEENDARSILRIVLVEQFKLLLKNYKENDKLHMNPSAKAKADADVKTGADAKDKHKALAKDNPVIDIIFRKIRNILQEPPQCDNYNNVIADLRELMHK